METVKAISLSVKPVKAELDSVKSTKAKTMTVKWKQDKKADRILHFIFYR